MPGNELPEGVREHLLAAGASEEEIDRVMDNDALLTLAGDLVRRRDIEWIPIEDIASTAGVSVEDVERYRLLVGLPARGNLLPEWTIYGLESYRVAASLVGDEVTHRVVSGSRRLSCHRGRRGHRDRPERCDAVAARDGFTAPRHPPASRSHDQ